MGDLLIQFLFLGWYAAPRKIYEIWRARGLFLYLLLVVLILSYPPLHYYLSLYLDGRQEHYRGEFIAYYLIIVALVGSVLNWVLYLVLLTADGQSARRKDQTAEALIEQYQAGQRSFRWVSLRQADLRDADLSGADLSGADLSGADLYGADLRDADLRDANLSDANLSDANLRGAVYNKHTAWPDNFRVAASRAVDRPTRPV